MTNKFGLLFFIFCCGLASSCSKDDPDLDNGVPESDWVELKAPDNMEFMSEITDIASDNYGNIFVVEGPGSQVARWDGNEWSIVGGNGPSPFAGGFRGPMAVDNWGNVYCVGLSSVVDPEYHIAKWDKITNWWTNLTSGEETFNNGIHSIAVDDFGNVYAGGNFIDWANNTSECFISQYNGSTWSVMGSKYDCEDKICIIVHSNSIYATLGRVNGNFSPYAVKWNGFDWSEIGGVDAMDLGTGQITCLTGDSNGNIYVGGYFVKNDTPHNVAKWSLLSNSWTLTENMMGYNYFVHSILSDGANNIFAAGDLYDQNGFRYIAKYDGIGWSNFGNLMANNLVNSICRDINGKLYAGGSFTNQNGHCYVALYKP